MTSRSESGTGRGRSNTALTTVKMAMFAAMPIASVSTEMIVKPGLDRRRRKQDAALRGKRHAGVEDTAGVSPPARITVAAM